LQAQEGSTLSVPRERRQIGILESRPDQGPSTSTIFQRRIGTGSTAAAT
jgi:hypothetical protein